MKLIISTKVRQKFTDKHGCVTESEIRQCFANLDKAPMIDGRAEHRTNPVTRWFISETNHGRLLKICYMPYPNGDYVIKTAFEPNATEIKMFNE
jgi:hypothetical protein